MASINLSSRDGKTWTFQPIGTNTICRIEEEMGLSFGQLLAKLGVGSAEQWSVATTRRFFQYCAHGPVTPTLEDIGDLFDHQGFERISEVLNMLIAPAYAREVVHA